MTILAKCDDIQKVDQGDFYGLIEQGTMWELLQCEACHKVTLRAGEYAEGFEEFKWRIIYPNRERPWRGSSRNRITMEGRLRSRTLNLSVRPSAGRAVYEPFLLTRRLSITFQLIAAPQ
jgi:hypothetical protein